MGGLQEPPPCHPRLCSSEYSLSQRVVLLQKTEVEGFDEADGHDVTVLLPAGTTGVIQAVYGMGVAAFYDAIFMLPDSSKTAPKLMVARVRHAQLRPAPDSDCKRSSKCRARTQTPEKPASAPASKSTMRRTAAKPLVDARQGVKRKPRDADEDSTNHAFDDASLHELACDIKMVESMCNGSLSADDIGLDLDLGELSSAGEDDGDVGDGHKSGSGCSGAGGESPTAVSSAFTAADDDDLYYGCESLCDELCAAVAAAEDASLAACATRPATNKRQRLSSVERHVAATTHVASVRNPAPTLLTTAPMAVPIPMPTLTHVPLPVPYLGAPPQTLVGELQPVGAMPPPPLPLPSPPLSAAGVAMV